MKYQSYNIKARLVYELKIEVKLKKFCWIRVARVFHFIPALPLIKWPVLLAWATSEPFKGC